MRQQQTRTTQERHERKLNELLKLPGNDRCADCNTKNPRWCSYSLGVFLCIRCASFHRKMGTHVSKVKSLSMDTWSVDQIEYLRQSGGNEKVNHQVNPCPDKHPLPVSIEEDEFQLEQYIRQKWEKRTFEEAPLLSSSRSSETLPSLQSISSTNTSLHELAGQAHPEDNSNPFMTLSPTSISHNPFLSLSKNPFLSSQHNPFTTTSAPAPATTNTNTNTNTNTTTATMAYSNNNDHNSYSYNNSNNNNNSNNISSSFWWNQ